MSKTKTTIKELWLVAYPLIVTNACFVIMQSVNRVMLSRYTPEAMAACVPAGSLSFTFVSLFMGLAGYTGVFVAQYHGKKKKANLTVSLWQGVWAAMLSAVFIILLTPVGLYIIEFFNHAPEIQALEKQYFFILNIFGGLIALNNALASFFTGRSKTAVTMYVNIFGNIINICVSYVLIFGKFGLPQMGIKGAAFGIVVAETIMLCTFLLVVFSADNRRVYRTSRLVTFHKQAFMRLLKFGTPNGFGFFMDVLSFSLFSFMTGSAGAVALMASGIVFSMQAVVFMPLLGLSIGTQVLVGKYMGMKDTKEAARVTKNALRLGFSYAGTLAVLFFIFPKIFISIFMAGHSPETEKIIETAVPLMHIIAVFVLGDCAYLIFGESIRGAGDTKFHMLIMMVSAWGIMMPGAAFLVYYMHADIFKVWSWFTFYAVTTGIIMWLRWKGGKWKSIDITA